MKTKRNKKFVTNKRKKNKKLINKSFKKLASKNKKSTRKIIQKGGVVGVYDTIRHNIKEDIRDCIEILSNGPIDYHPIKDDYEPTISAQNMLKGMKTMGKSLGFNPRPNLNCIDTLKYYNTSKLSFRQLQNYLQFYNVYNNFFGKDESLKLFLLGHLYIFHELYNRISNKENLFQLFSSVNPILIESFVCKDPDNNFFWVNYNKNKTLSVVREKGHQIADTAKSKIKGVDYQEAAEVSSLPFKIKKEYTDYITLKNPVNLVRIFEEYSPYYSPIEYLGLTNDSGNDIAKLDEFKFKIINLEKIDVLYNSHSFIRKFDNIHLISQLPLFQPIPSKGFSWDLTFDIPYDNTNLGVIHSVYNTNRDENLKSFFKDSFIRTRETLYIEKDGITHLMDEPDMFESIYNFLMLLSGLTDEQQYNFELFKSEFDKNKVKIRFDLLRVILTRIGFPEQNVMLCLDNLRHYLKVYFLSKNAYLFDVFNIKTTVGTDFFNLYGVFSSYTDENKIYNGQLQTNVTDKITWQHNETKPNIIEIINRFVLSNTENKLPGFAKEGNQEGIISCESAFYNIIENGRQRGFGACLFNLICIGNSGQVILAHIIQVTIYSKNDNENISDFQLKYLLIWCNKDDVVYKEIDYIDITENFKNCFLNPIFTILSNPIDVLRVNIREPMPGSNPGWIMKMRENVTNILSHKKNETPVPIDYDESKTNEIDNVAPSVSVNPKLGFFKNIFSRNNSEPASTGHIEVGGKKQRTKKRRYKSKK
jgi:hypothetical protein